MERMLRFSAGISTLDSPQGKYISGAKLLIPQFAFFLRKPALPDKRNFLYLAAALMRVRKLSPLALAQPRRSLGIGHSK